MKHKKQMNENSLNSYVEICSQLYKDFVSFPWPIRFDVPSVSIWNNSNITSDKNKPTTFKILNKSLYPGRFTVVIVLRMYTMLFTSALDFTHSLNCL